MAVVINAKVLAIKRLDTHSYHICGNVQNKHLSHYQNHALLRWRQWERDSQILYTKFLHKQLAIVECLQDKRHDTVHSYKPRDFGK